MRSMAAEAAAVPVLLEAMAPPVTAELVASAHSLPLLALRLTTLEVVVVPTTPERAQPPVVPVVVVLALADQQILRLLRLALAQQTLAAAVVAITVTIQAT